MGNTEVVSDTYRMKLPHRTVTLINEGNTWKILNFYCGLWYEHLISLGTKQMTSTVATCNEFKVAVTQFMPD